MPNPLDAITDTQLYNLQLALQLQCGRSHSTQRRRRQAWFCFLSRVLQVEADLRGVPVPAAPFHAGDLPPYVA